MVKLPQLAGDPGESCRPVPLKSVHGNNVLVDTVAVTIWGGAEGALTIMAASIPVLRALIRSNRPSIPPAELSPSDVRRLQLPASFATSEGSASRVEHGSLQTWEEKN